MGLEGEKWMGGKEMQWGGDEMGEREIWGNQMGVEMKCIWEEENGRCDGRETDGIRDVIGGT